MPGKWSIFLQPEFLEDLEYWCKTQPRVAVKIVGLMREIERDPTTGTGQPEHLKHLPGNIWSRRITQEHRIVYLIGKERVDFLQARFHY